MEIRRYLHLCLPVGNTMLESTVCLSDYSENGLQRGIERSVSSNQPLQASDNQWPHAEGLLSTYNDYRKECDGDDVDEREGIVGRHLVRLVEIGFVNWGIRNGRRGQSGGGAPSALYGRRFEDSGDYKPELAGGGFDGRERNGGARSVAHSLVREGPFLLCDSASATGSPHTNWAAAGLDAAIPVSD